MHESYTDQLIIYKLDNNEESWDTVSTTLIGDEIVYEAQEIVYTIGD